MTLVLLFPGQSSRYPGMLQKLVELRPANAALLAEASELLGRDLASHYAADAKAPFALNRDVQVGVFLANHMFLQILEDAGIEAELSLGQSLGEYNHLVHIEALAFADACKLVNARGEAYDRGPRGGMASIFPIELEDALSICERVRHLGVLEVSNRNSPTQNVFSGDISALDAAMYIAEDEFYAQSVVIERQVPMHCSTFQATSLDFRAALEATHWQPAKRPYLPNCMAEHLDDVTPERFVELLCGHVYKPVEWRRSIDHVVARHPEAIFIEVGPLKVLTDLMRPKWHRNGKFHMDSRENTGDHISRVIASLGAERASA